MEKYKKIQKKIKEKKFIKKSGNSFRFKKHNKISFKMSSKKRVMVLIGIVLLLFASITLKIFNSLNISLINWNNDIKSKKNNKGFLKINTIHKSKYENYNYKENIIVYKDLDNSISYTPITESNFIKKSSQITNDTYFSLCDNKTLLDETKYKRNSKPKISVIIPYYNKDVFSLFIVLRSIQNQSLKDIEIIFVDDGSSEKKINELIEEIKNDNRIILLKHKENKGTLMSRVDGVRYASGEYILNMDQDDLLIDNLLLETLYRKVKELNVDILHFTAISYKNGITTKGGNLMPANKKITQPELKIAFLERIGEKRFDRFYTRQIWDKLVRRDVYLNAIKDLGDEYLNHRIFLYEDTLMMFELSQIAYSYYYYDYIGYRRDKNKAGKSRDASSTGIRIMAMNQLYFIKLLLYKIDPKYDRYIIFTQWGFAYCGSEAFSLDRSEIDLLQEVLEVIDELERLYKNTAKELLECANKIKKHFGLA